MSLLNHHLAIFVVLANFHRWCFISLNLASKDAEFQVLLGNLCFILGWHDTERLEQKY